MAVTTRLMFLVLVAAIFVPAVPQCARAQEDPNEAPLGDVARSFRKKAASPEVIIDNDNFSKVVEDAASRRLAGSTMVFSLDPGGRNFHAPSPEASCSFSFSARAGSLSDSVVLDELPRNELAKLDGPATIDGDSLQVSMHNGTEWELREVVIGLTILRRPATGNSTTASYGPARIVPAMAVGSTRPAQDSSQKQPDVTVLLRAKGSAAPSATALFRTQLNFALFPDQEWHWAIVRAKGVAPQAPAEAMTTQPEPNPGQLPALLPDAATQSLPMIPVLNPANPDVAAH